MKWFLKFCYGVYFVCFVILGEKWKRFVEYGRFVLWNVKKILNGIEEYFYKVKSWCDLFVKEE